MDIDDMVGHWALSATARVDGELEVTGNDIAPGVHDAWLRGTGQSELDSLEPAAGLTLLVNDNATFSEVGESTISLFDPAGVEISGDTPYSGRLEATSSGISVFTDTEAIATEVAGVTDPSVLRVSDDVDIAERFQVIDGRLVRTTNAVTDGLYTTRIVLVYERTDHTLPPAEEVDESDADVTERDPEVLRLQDEIATRVVDTTTVSWERIIVKAEAFHMGGHSQQQSFISYCVHRNDAGVHSLEEIDLGTEAMDLFTALRERIKEVNGRRWGVCVLKIEPPREVDFQISYEASPKAKGDYLHRDDYYERHLPFFLAEKGLDR